MRIDDVYVQSIGSYLPEPVSIQWAVDEGLYSAEDVLKHGLKSTLVAGDMPPAQMAAAAAHSALDRVGQDPKGVDVLLHAGVFPQGPEGWSLPGYVLRDIGGSGTPIVEIRQGCNGMLVAMDLAVGQLTGVAGYSTALLTTADNFSSPIYDRWQGYSFISGDGASAMLLGTQPGFARVAALVSRTLPELEAMHRGAEPLFPPTFTVNRPIDLGGRASAFARDVMPTIESARKMIQAQTELVQQAAAEAGIAVTDLARVIYTNVVWHVASAFVMNPLGLPMDRSTWEFGSTVGHMGASDHVVGLEHLLLTGKVAPGDHVLMLGGAPGYSISAAVLQILDLPAWTRAGAPCAS